MKPRERLKQKQTSRMYLRKKDHRDCIMNETYHNAIWMKKKQDGKDRDELVWLKYPQRYLYLRNKYTGGSSATQYTKGWIDIDRLWINGKDDLGSTDTYICKLGDYVATSRTAFSSSWTLDITQDGCIHKSTTFSDNRLNIHRFGSNSIIVLWNSNSYPFSTIYMNIYEIDEFSIEKMEISKYNTVLPLSGRYYDWYYLGATESGCLIYFKSGNVGDVYSIEVSDGGYVATFLYKDYPEQTQKPNLIGNASTRTIERNGIYYCLNTYSEKPSGSPVSVQDVVVQYSSNNGYNWDIARARITQESASTSIPKAYFCLRDDTIYVYVTYTEDGTVFKTKTFYMNNANELEEIPIINNLLTVPIRGNMGKGTLTNKPTDYVQIQLDSTVPTTELSYHIKDLLNNEIQESWGSIEFKDGELQEQVTEKFIILSTTYGGGRTIYFYIDAELKPNIDNFAWISDSFGSSNGAEKLMDGDYCL